MFYRSPRIQSEKNEALQQVDTHPKEHNERVKEKDHRRRVYFGGYITDRLSVSRVRYFSIIWRLSLQCNHKKGSLKTTARVFVAAKIMITVFLRYNSQGGVFCSKLFQSNTRSRSIDNGLSCSMVVDEASLSSSPCRLLHRHFFFFP